MRPTSVGASSMVEVIISPSPWLKSVTTLVLRCSKLSTWPARWVARIREVTIGCSRPWRGSSARCHISRTGLPIFCEIFAASMAASLKSLWPKEPPPVITLTLTWSWGMPSALAMFCWARIGTFRPAQIVARSSRTSATAQLGSSAALLRNMNVKLGLDRLGEQRHVRDRERQLAPCAAGPGSSGRTRPRRARVPDDVHRADRVDALAEGLRAHRDAGVDLRHVLDAGHRAGSCACCAAAAGEPLSVGGRQTIVGSAPGTCRSIANFFRPVTAARASSRLRGVPMTEKSDRGLRSTRTARSVGLAALVASSA